MQQQDILKSAPAEIAGSPLPPQAEGTAEQKGVAEPLPTDILLAILAAQDKKAEDFRVFDLRRVTSLTEFFLICSGTNQRQNQAISDEIFKLLKERQQRAPLGVEGYDKADWILMDYGDFIVHVLSTQARKYYDLERLWRQATECPVPEDAAALLAAEAPARDAGSEL